VGLKDLIQGKPQLVVLPNAPADALGDGLVRGRSVQLWRPPVMFDAEGRTMPGVTRDLVAQYLVSSVSAITRTNVGPVSVEWVKQQGRFVTTHLMIHAWGQGVTVLHPVGIVSRELKHTHETYMGGMALKVRELHKGNQDFAEANRLIATALGKVHALRDDDTPHFNDAEFLFVVSGMTEGLTLSALIPVAKNGAEQAIGTRLTV
jgi:hypothetical protein